MIISIHASAREATNIIVQQRVIINISIHASAREATAKSLRMGIFNQFQSTPPRGRRPLSHSQRTTVPIFQSTPPRGRRLTNFFLCLLPAYFNPRLREGGDPSAFVPAFPRYISIHASAREATRCRNKHFLYKWISIHASAREATAVCHNQCQSVQFQSTPPRGRRPNRSQQLPFCFNFNPRLREGGDCFNGVLCPHFFVFQSTPPRGRRHETLSCH